MSQDLSNIVVAYKTQSAVGTPASGAGATGIELLPSQGFQSQVAAIASELLARSRMAARSRKGSEFYNWAGEAELQVGNLNGVLEASLGGTWSAPITLDQTTLTSCTISGTGTVITFAGGNTLSAGALVGMTAKFANMSVTANNGVYFPILSISPDGRTWTVPTGILADNTADTAFSVILSAAVYTTTPYTKRAITMEHYLGDIDRSLVGSDFRFNGLNFSMAADKMIKVGLAMGGANLSMLSTAASPNFTTPTFTTGESLVLLDGAIYFNGVKRINLASFNFGLQSPISGLPLLSRKTSPDAFLGQFKMDGSFTGVIDDGADFDSFKNEDQVSIYLHCAEQSATNPNGMRYVGIYIGNMSFGDWNMPAGGEGPAIQTVKMNGGRDKRGTALGYADTCMLISTSN